MHTIIGDGGACTVGGVGGVCIVGGVSDMSTDVLSGRAHTFTGLGAARTFGGSVVHAE